MNALNQIISKVSFCSAVAQFSLQILGSNREVESYGILYILNSSFPEILKEYSSVYSKLKAHELILNI